MVGPSKFPVALNKSVSDTSYIGYNSNPKISLKCYLIIEFSLNCSPGSILSRRPAPDTTPP